MIFDRKNFPVKITKERKVVFTDFSGGMSTAMDEYALPLKNAKLAYNCDGRTGVLKQSLGFDELEINGQKIKFDTSKALKLWHYRRFDKAAGVDDDRLVLLDANMELYCLRLNKCGEGFSKVNAKKFSSVPSAINYRLGDEDIIIFCSETDDMLIWNGSSAAYTVAGAPKISSMAIHFERLFATTAGQKNAVWFSDDLNPLNWNISSTEAGYIEMADERGSLNRVVSIFNHVYVFRTHGIARITAYGDQSEFFVSQLFTPSGKIYPETVTLCGDKIMFLCDDGFYLFDGTDTKRVLQNLDGLIHGVQNKYAHGCYFNGRYFLALKMNFKDDKKVLCEKDAAHKNNAVLEYEIQTGRVSVCRGMDVNCFLPLQTESLSQLLFLMRNETRLGGISDSGKVFEKTLPKCWATPITDLGSADKQKNLKYVFVLSKRDIKLEIRVDGRIYTVDIQGSEQTTKTRLGIRGYAFSFTFLFADQKPFLHRPMLVFDVT